MSATLSVLAAVIALCEPFFDEVRGRFGYLDCQGKVAVPARYFVAQPFTEGGIAAVLDEDGWYYIARTGEFVIRPMVYDNGPDSFSDGLSRYLEKGKYGFFDTAGRVVIEAQYDFAFPFTDGRARVGSDCSFIEAGEHTSVDCSDWSDIALPDEMETSQKPANERGCRDTAE